MYEYATISSSSYDPASLASKLTEKSAEGWTVAAIVPTGGDVTAFLSRESSGAAAPAAAPMQEAAPAPAPEPVMAPVAAEPAGWAVAPDPAPAPMSSAPATVIQTPMAQISDSYQPANTYQPAAAPAPAPAPAAAPTPAVPAGWYADPAGRFELRYWDGSTWTEHVSTGGVQSTNPPVA